MNDGGWACWGNGYSDLVWKGYAFRNGQMAYSADKGNVSRKKKKEEAIRTRMWRGIPQ